MRSNKPQPAPASTAEPSNNDRVKALVVYECMWRNTEQVARAVAAGLRDRMDVQIVEVTDAPGKPGEDIELIITGGPTHAFSMSRPSTRADALSRGAHGSPSTGLREWLDQLPSGRPSQSVATFDTGVDKVRRLPGSAAKSAAKTLHHHGYRSSGNVHLASIPMDDMEENAIIVNASTACLGGGFQKSLVEGFGLTVTKPMWNGRAVLASRVVGGSHDQIT